jgi:pimeloyl-ACP methyl ester carboxylesterase
MRLTIAALALVAAAGAAPAADDTIGTAEHHVALLSAVPAIAGKQVQLYVREHGTADVLKRGAGDKVVLFVHGAGTPAEVSFDVPYQDYSWMTYLAKAGYDVFTVDMEGYGRSDRPPQMEQPCNLAPAQQDQFIPALIPARCAPFYPGPITTIASDWNDISATVAYIKKLRHVSQVNLIGWSQGGPRTGGWTAQHPHDVARLIVLAPAYNRATPAERPPAGASGVVFNTQSRTEFDANWARQTGCADQVDKATADSVWSEMIASDPVGATWGPGVRRAPQTAVWGWTTEVVKKMSTPTLMVSGQYDKQVDPERVREFYADLGSSRKVFVDLACSSHNAMWEKNHLLLFKASLEWLNKGTVNGEHNAMLKLGY